MPGVGPFWAAQVFMDGTVRIAHVPAYYRDCGADGHHGDSEMTPYHQLLMDLFEPVSSDNLDYSPGPARPIPSPYGSTGSDGGMATMAVAEEAAIPATAPTAG